MRIAPKDNRNHGECWDVLEMEINTGQELGTERQ